MYALRRFRPACAFAKRILECQGCKGSYEQTTQLFVANEDSNRTARMRSPIWVFVGHTCQKVSFSYFAIHMLLRLREMLLKYRQKYLLLRVYMPKRSAAKIQLEWIADKSVYAVMPKRSAAKIQPERIPDRRVYTAMPENTAKKCGLACKHAYA